MAEVTGRKAASQSFLDRIGWDDAARATVAGDASNRSYDRLTRADGTTAILMDAPPDRGEDVRPFVKIAEHLTANGLSAPNIYHQDAENGFLLIEDLGNALFARKMAAEPGRQEMLYRAATDVLVDLHAFPLLPLPVCDAAWLTGMTELVFEWYAAPDEDTLRRFREIFTPLADSVDEARRVIILRDYHAENLLWLPDRTGSARVGLLDFQDALLGHPAYDLVSVLQDARRDVPPAIETAMIAHYLARTGLPPAPFTRAYAILGVQRNLRILGIFARLCLRDGKPHYVDMIPRVWEYVIRNLAHPDLTDLATFLRSALPAPTQDFLEHLKRQCTTIPDP